MLVVQRHGTRRWANASLDFFERLSARSVGIQLRYATHIPGITTFCEQAEQVSAARVLIAPKGAEISGDAYSVMCVHDCS